MIALFEIHVGEDSLLDLLRDAAEVAAGYVANDVQLARRADALDRVRGRLNRNAGDGFERDLSAGRSVDHQAA